MHVLYEDLRDDIATATEMLECKLAVFQSLFQVNYQLSTTSLFRVYYMTNQAEHKEVKRKC